MLFSSLPAVLATVLSIASLTSAAPATLSTACNNSPDLCNKAYNEITYLGAHDIAFLRDSSTGFSVSGNQFYNATIALSAGVRLLQAQVHTLNGVLELCHTSCSLLDGGSLEAFLSDIKFWMDSNPNEVVTLLLVNSDNNSTATFGSVFSASGIDQYGYTPFSTTGPQNTWPTLQTMISANTRLVTFIASIDYSTTYPYLIPEFNYVFETPFSVTNLSDFTCNLDRPSTLTSATAAISAGYMPLLNHFVDTVQAFNIEIPDITDIATTNSPSQSLTGAVGTVLNECASQYGIKPSFILVDFWNVAGPIAAVDTLNGITPTGRTTVSQGVLSQTTSGAAKVSGGLSRWAVTGAVLMGVAGINVFYL
jgi:hypothetical protein